MQLCLRVLNLSLHKFYILNGVAKRKKCLLISFRRLLKIAEKYHHILADVFNCMDKIVNFTTTNPITKTYMCNKGQNHHKIVNNEE